MALSTPHAWPSRRPCGTKAVWMGGRVRVVEAEAALRDLPFAIRPPYETAVVNAPIELYGGILTLSQARGGSPVPGRVFLRWLPRPRTEFELSDAGLTPSLDDDRLEINGLNSSCRVSTTAVVPQEGRFSGRLRDNPELQDTAVDRITFHLANFHSYVGDAICHDDGGASRGRLVLAHRPWRVTLDQVTRADELRRALAADGGFGITHVGRIERSDGRPFSTRKAADLLKAAYYFISFCRGIWCGPILAVGDLGGIRNWLQWVAPRIASWRYRQSWWPELEPLQGPMISRAFSGFMTLWNKPLWRDPLMNSIHWYVEANSNSGGLEGGIILAQAALELLAWLVLVDDQETAQYSERQLNTESAEARIRKLLGVLAIPAGVPPDLPALAAVAGHLQSSDGIGVMVDIRNSLVHPRKARREQLARVPVAARFEALTLALYFLEVVLLRIFGYAGLYYSRLKASTNAEVRTEMPLIGA